MKGIKIKLSKWLLRKAVKWSEIEPLDFYKEFSFEIEKKVKEIRDIEQQLAKDNFKRFKGACIYGVKSISDDIYEIDKHTHILTKQPNNTLLVPEWNKNHYENIPSSYESY